MLSRLSQVLQLRKEVIESMYSEYGFAMGFEGVTRLRHMTSRYGVVMIFEEAARKRAVLHNLSSSEFLERIWFCNGLAGR